MNSDTIKPSMRENILLTLLSKLIKEYKLLLEYARREKPLKIVDIIHISSIPGETKFIIQVTNKNCLAHLSAAEIINQNYNLDDFNNFHAEIIRKAAQGRLMEFLKLKERSHKYKIISKKFDAQIQQYVFTIESEEKGLFKSTAQELSKNKNLIENISMQDIYDVGFTQGTESILKEKSSLLLAKRKHAL